MCISHFISQCYILLIPLFLILVSGGTSSYHTWAHIDKVVREKDFSVSVHNVTEQIGILSIQGPNRYSNEMRIRIYIQIITKMYDNIIYLTLFI